MKIARCSPSAIIALADPNKPKMPAHLKWTRGHTIAAPNPPISFHASPNCDDRPDGIRIDTIVVHATVLNTLDEVISHFENPEMKVSAHYTVDRDGRTVSHVPEGRRAWHAGPSRMNDGRERVNDFSIGIELVNRNDGLDPFPEKQIEAMRDLIRSIMKRHPIRYIIPHYECSVPEGRKTDPAGFQTSWIRDLLECS